MLADLFKLLNTQSVQAAGPRKVELSDPRKVSYVIGETLHTVDIPPPPRGHVTDTLYSFLESAKHYGDKSGVVWHNERDVYLVIDDKDRRDTIHLPLRKSEQFSTLEKLDEARVGLSQRDFVRLLRHDLAGAVSDELRPAISKLEFVGTSGVKSDISPGREHGSREFANDVKGEIPETFLATVSVYANTGLRQPRGIKLSLDYKLPPGEVSFTVKPLPDEIAIAIQDAQSELHDLLVKELGKGIKVFAGTP